MVFFFELLSLEDGAGAKPIILKNRKCVAGFSFPEGSIDIDNWRDYERLANVPVGPARSSSTKKSSERAEETARES
jgi:hypothetical protein